MAARRVGFTERNQRIYRGADLGTFDAAAQLPVGADACGFGELVPRVLRSA